MTAALPARNLMNDQKGAVMLTGLFMSCLLIGALWFIIGVGDAINFRDQMQEAADHGAFTAAAFNAKGMNFIALCNLIMIAGTVIHIVLGIASDVAGAIYSVCLAACIASCFVGCEACECVDPTWEAWSNIFKVWDVYFKAMTKGFKVLHKGQQIASYAYPAAGSVNAFEVGLTYNNDAKRMEPPLVVALSASMVPAGPLQALADKVGNAVFKPGKPAAGATKEGFLPVEPRKYEELCIKVVSVASTGVINLLGAGKGLGNKSLGGDAAAIFNNIIGSGLQWRYCNKSVSLPFFARDPSFWEPFPLSGHGGGMDSFWGEIGWYRVYQPAKNGTVFFQTWAANVMPVLKDGSDHIVENAGKKPTQAAGGGTQVRELGTGYFAQAEMYFDCDDEWGNAPCNFEDNALFAIKWRARLRKLDYPAIGSGIVGAALSGIVASQGFKDFDKGIGKKIAGILGSTGLGTSALNKAIDTMLDMGERYLRGAITKGLGPLLDPRLGGVYH